MACSNVEETCPLLKCLLQGVQNGWLSNSAKVAMAVVNDRVILYLNKYSYMSFFTKGV